MPVAVPLDEYPVHQVPLSMQHVASSDRNAYDRCIFQAHDRTGDVILITGLGVYPNLGVIDAYATLRQGDRQVAVRMSEPLGDDRLSQVVGPYRIEVLEPLRKLRLVCDADDHGLGFDLTWDASSPPIDEPQHIIRSGDRVIIEGCRFAQTGVWSGAIRVDGAELDASGWTGTRDRSWGIRPVGEAEPPGRAAENPLAGFWWCWVPLRFDDFSVMVIAQEEPDGHRILHEAVRIWPVGSGRGPEQLGWPEFEIAYRSGSRHPEHATIHLRDLAARKPLTLEIEPLGHIPLTVGCGYNGDPDWNHGLWKGAGWIEGATYDLNDPAVAGRIPFSVVDHAARATLDGVEGFGIFEHASIGRHDPTGFADYLSVAP